MRAKRPMSDVYSRFLRADNNRMGDAIDLRKSREDIS